MHHQFVAAPQCEARNRCDQGLFDFFDGIPGRKLVDEEHIDRALIGHLSDVGTGGEGPVVAREHDGPHFVILIQAFQGIAQLAHELQVQRVQFFGSVEADKGHMGLAAGLDKQKGMVHKTGDWGF